MKTEIKQIPWLALVIALLLVALYAPTLPLMAYVWWNDPSYSHGLIMPLVVALMLWMQRHTWRTEPVRPAQLSGGALIVCALVLLYVGARGPVYLAQYVSLLLMLTGVTLFAGGFGHLRLAFAPLALFALAIPLPTIVMNKLAAPLQLFASQCAVWGMHAFDIPLVRTGNVIEMLPRGSFKPHKLEVAEACSGIRSLVSLITMAFMLAYFTYPNAKNGGGGGTWWKRYGFWRSVVLVLAAFPIAILTNALRVSGTGVLSHYYGIAAAEGFFHSFSGAITYAVAAVLLLATGWLMDRMQRKATKRPPRAQQPNMKTKQDYTGEAQGAGLARERI